MTNRSNRDTEYVVVRDRKPKKPIRYYYNDNDDDDDDNDHELPIQSTRRIVRRKPTKEQRIKYISLDDVESDHRRQRVVDLNDHRIKIRNTTNGEQVVLDEDNNILKIIRNSRTPTPPLVENRRIKIQSREPRTLYYETSDGHLIARPPKNHAVTKLNKEFVYAEDEPTKVIRKVIVDPKTGNQETIYEKDKPKKQIKHKYVIQKRSTDAGDESDDEDDQLPQQSQYVQVVQRRTVPTQVVKQESPTKYVMIRKKVESEPVYAATSSIPTVKTNRRVVYESPTKDTTTKYVYATNGKYYK